MGIRKYDKEGKSFYEVRVSVRDLKGRQVCRRRGGITSEAKAKRIELELKMELLRVKDDRAIPLWEDWVDSCLERIRLQFEPSTVLNYRGNLGKWVTPHFQGQLISRIRQSDIHDVIFKYPETVGNETKKNILKHLRRIFAMAVEEGYLSHNPTVGLKVKIAQKKMECLNHTEIGILLKEAHFRSHEFFDVWSLALLTGMRSGELHALQWTDVDFENRFISVNKSWTPINGLGPTKNSKTREIPISGELETFLKELKLKSQESHVLSRIRDWDFGNQAKILRDFCREIGITEVRFHDLRSTFITQLLLNDVPLVKVMYIVGHARMQTTQRYLRNVAKEVRGVTDSLNITLPRGPIGENNVVELGV